MTSLSLLAGRTVGVEVVKVIFFVFPTVLGIIPVNASSLPKPSVTCQEEILLDTKAIVAM